MQLYDATTDQGLCQEIDDLCDTTDSNYSRQKKTRRLNTAYEQIVGDIIGVSGNWQFDDSNYTTLPIGTGTLVEGQTSYQFAGAYLDIIEVDILTLNGVYQKIFPLDASELNGISVEQLTGTTTSNTVKGWPIGYDKVGDVLRLFPASTSTQMTLTNGLKVYFQRTANLFTVASNTNDDATTPGFYSTYHSILAYMAAIPYCTTHHPDRVAAYMNIVADMKKNLLKQYTRREKDSRKQATTKQIIYR